MITITGDNIVWLVGVLTAIGVLIGFFVKVVHWVDNQKLQDQKIKDLENKHNNDMHEVKEELTVLSYGLLATLKGLQGDKANVPDAIDKLEKHLNKKAHE